MYSTAKKNDLCRGPGSMHGEFHLHLSAADAAKEPWSLIPVTTKAPSVIPWKDRVLFQLIFAAIRDRINQNVYQRFNSATFNVKMVNVES